MNKKSIIYLLVTILILGVFLSGCSPKKEVDKNGGGETGKPVDAAKVFKAAMTANPLSLDEGYSTTTATRQVSSHVFETLFTFGENYEVIPQLADSYESSEDLLTYNIKLRENVKFHDGSEFTAKDVIATLERNKTTSMYNENFNKITAIEEVNDHEIKISLSEPIALIPMLAFPQRVTMIPAEVAEKNMGQELRAESIIGTGPYKLVEWTPDVHVKLEKFNDYAIDDRFDGSDGLGGKREATFDTIYFLPVPEAESRIAGLESGEFDYAESIPNTSYDRIANNNDLLESIVKPRWSVLLEFNHTNWPTSDINFKRALAYALDMEKVLMAVTSGNKDFYSLDPSIYTPEQFYFTEAGSEDIYNKPNLDKVKELLEQANYKGEEIVYLVNKDFDWMYKACLSLAEQWQEAGINVKLEFSDWATQIAKAQSMEGWNINQTGWSTRLDPTQVAWTIRTGTTAGYGYSNAETDKLIDEVSLGKPEEERKEAWIKIQEKIWEDMAVLKVGDYYELEAIADKYEGYESFYIVPRFWNLNVK